MEFSAKRERSCELTSGIVGCMRVVVEETRLVRDRWRAVRRRGGEDQKRGKGKRKRKTMDGDRAAQRGERKIEWSGEESKLHGGRCVTVRDQMSYVVGRRQEVMVAIRQFILNPSWPSA
jgi:hypothetical protein